MNRGELICTAIQSCNLLSLRYRSLPRVVVPCALGVHKSTGNLLLRSYQVRGTSESGNLPLWRLYDVAAMSRIEILDTTFETAPNGYNRNDRAFRRIHCQL